MDNTTNDYSYLRTLQLQELELLKQFIQFADENNIEWFAEGGTVLGAYRHKGFIPWDEDIDIGMPRKDYEKFLKLAKSKKTPFPVKSYRWNSDFEYGYSRIELPNVIVTRSYLGEIVDQFAWIDVSPMDGMPSNKLMFKAWVKYLLLRRLIHSFSKFGERQYADVNQRVKSPVLQAAYKVLFGAKAYKLFNPLVEARKLDKACAKFSTPSTKYYANIMGGSKDKDIFPIEVYGGGVELPFEDIMIRCPEKLDVYLRQTYGDTYMEFPPEEDRHRHRIIDVRIINSEEKENQ